MAGWNGSGGFTFPYSWEADAAAGIPITASRMDTQFDTVSVDGFGNTLTRDGQGQPTANLPMAGFRHTGAAAAVGTNDYVILSQINGGTLAADFATVRVQSGETIVTGGLVILAGGAGIAGGLTVTTGGLIVSAGTVALSPTTGNVTIAPVAGSLVVNPGTAGGTMNNVVIGGSTPVAATFTTATVNNPGTTGSQAVNYSQFPTTNGATGTRTLPGGSIEKWGTGSITNGTGTVSFAAGFPTSCDNIIVTIKDGGAPADVSPLIIGAYNTAGFAIYCASGQSPTFFWQARGS